MANHHNKKRRVQKIKRKVKEKEPKLCLDWRRVNLAARLGEKKVGGLGISSLGWWWRVAWRRLGQGQQEEGVQLEPHGCLQGRKCSQLSSTLRWQGLLPGWGLPSIPYDNNPCKLWLARLPGEPWSLVPQGCRTPTSKPPQLPRLSEQLFWLSAALPSAPRPTASLWLALS